MFIKKHFFNYPMSKESVQVGTFKLEGFDEVISDGVLLIEKRDGNHNFYLPSLDINDSSDVNIICIFSDIEEYVYENGLLFIKDNDFFVVIEPNSFCWKLKADCLADRIESAPKIPCTKDSKVTFLDFDFLHGIFVKIDNMNYFVNFYKGTLGIKKIEGIIKPSKIFNTVIVSSQFPNFKYFFEDGIKSSTFHSIEAFDIAPEHYTGYLCYNDLGQIKALRIGMDIPNSSSSSYSVEFDTPLRDIKFLGRNINSSVEGGFSDLWLIETIDYKKKVLLQEI